MTRCQGFNMWGWSRSRHGNGAGAPNALAYRPPRRIATIGVARLQRLDYPSAGSYNSTLLETRFVLAVLRHW